MVVLCAEMTTDILLKAKYKVDNTWVRSLFDPIFSEYKALYCRTNGACPWPPVIRALRKTPKPMSGYVASNSRLLST